MPVPPPLRVRAASASRLRILSCPDDRDRRLLRTGRLCRVCVVGLWDRGCSSRGSLRILVAALPRQHRHRGAAAAGSRKATMTRKQQRLGLLALAMAALGGATVLVLSAFNDNLVFFYSPSEMKVQAGEADRRGVIGW